MTQINNINDLNDRKLLGLIFSNQIQLARQLERIELHLSKNDKNYYQNNNSELSYKDNVGTLLGNSKQVISATNEWLKEYEEFIF
jgi:hypothetical protein